MLCNYDNMKKLRDKALEIGTKININGKEYSSKYKKCVEGFLDISNSHINFGIILVPDDAVEGLLMEKNHFTANYKGTTDDEKQKVEDNIVALDDDSYLKSIEGVVELNAMTKISLYEASIGLGAIVTFIGLYLGIIFLISGAAILSLKELS